MATLNTQVDDAHAALQAAKSPLAATAAKVQIATTTAARAVIAQVEPALTASTPAAADIMARTMWGEARGEGSLGLSYVCNVIMNRAAHPRWWGNTPVSVCLDPYQFSCWLADDPNLPKLKTVTTADQDFRLALQIATEALAGGLPDATGLADSYYDTSIPAPSWARNKTPVLVYKDFRFYRLEL